MLTSVSFAATMFPLSALLPSLHWGEVHSRLLHDSQSGITSQKCGLRGRPQGFRVRFGTGLSVMSHHTSESNCFYYVITNRSFDMHFLPKLQQCPSMKDVDCQTYTTLANHSSVYLLPSLQSSPSFRQSALVRGVKNRTEKKPITSK